MPQDHLPTDYKKNSILFGILYGLFFSVLLYLSFKFDFKSDTLTLSILSLGVTLLLLIYPIYQFKKNNANLLRISQALKIGLIVGLIGGLIYAAYTYFHYTIVDADFIADKLIESEKVLEESAKDLTKEQIKQAKEVSQAIVSPFSLSTINLLTLVFKAFVIAIVTGVIKKS